MNKFTKNKILKRKEHLNKKLALQIIFSIILVTTVIVTKQLNTNISKQFINTADEKLNESIKPSELKESFFSFIGEVKDKISFMSKSKNEYAAPVNGRIYQNYGLNNSSDAFYYNHGIDILSNTQSIKSISQGTVKTVGNNEKLSGYVVIDNKGMTIIYGKLKESFVKEGDKVSKNDIIGSLSEDNMLLHIEIWKDGESINPVNLFDLDQ